MNIPATTAVNSTTTTAVPLVSNVTSTTINIPNNPINISITGINPKEEWAEIKNSGPDTDITNWIISDSANHKYVFSGVLYSNASMKLHTGHGIDNSTDTYWNYKISVWNDDGDTATLADAGGNVVDKYTYNKSDAAATVITTSAPAESTAPSTASTTIASTSTTASSTTATSTTISETTTTTAAAIGHVMLSEVFYDPLGNEAKEEWIKLYNPTGTPIDLANWTISDNSGIWKFPAVVIRSASNLTIARNFTAFQSMTSCSPDVSGLTRSLNNDGDQLFLNDTNGDVIDFVAWEGGFNNTYPAWNTSAMEGKSLRRISLADTDTIADWAEDEAHPC
ncbi:MAG: lamin tail domain-containing protein [Candidatus Aenigmarchaeota archaeon]|nr:lamin tail domain-containing protein [Candidatus Aenigmarchaeota archaeon]